MELKSNSKSNSGVKPSPQNILSSSASSDLLCKLEPLQVPDVRATLPERDVRYQKNDFEKKETSKNPELNSNTGFTNGFTLLWFDT